MKARHSRQWRCLSYRQHVDYDNAACPSLNYIFTGFAYGPSWRSGSPKKMLPVRRRNIRLGVVQYYEVRKITVLTIPVYFTSAAVLASQCIKRLYFRVESCCTALACTVCPIILTRMKVIFLAHLPIFLFPLHSDGKESENVPWELCFLFSWRNRQSAFYAGERRCVMSRVMLDPWSSCDSSKVL